MSEIERKLLSHLTDSANIAEAWDMGLRAEAFEEPLCRAVFAFTVEYWAANQMALAPTQYVITEEFPGFAFESTADESLAWLTERLQRRYATNVVQDMLRSAAVGSVEDPIATLKKLHVEAYSAVETVAPRLTRSNMADNIDERRQRYAEKQSRPEGLGLPLGISELDAHTGGILPGELVAVGALSKVGKSFFLAHAAAAQLKAGLLPIVFTLEMSIQEMEDRIDAYFSGVSYDRLFRAELTMEESQRLRQAQDRLAEMGGVLVESPPPGERTVTAIVNRARYVGADFLLIDQLTHMEASRDTRTLKEHNADVMKGLSTEVSRPGKEIATVIAVQLRRPEKNEGANDVSLYQFANAAEVEREVDLAIGLSQSGEERRNHVMHARILGSRRSDIRDFVLRWELTEASRIELLDPEMAPA